MKTECVAFFVLQLVISVLSNNGNSEVSSRLQGGSLASLEHIYYHASIQLKINTTVNEHKCSGAIVSAKSVVTTARCLHNTDKKLYDKSSLLVISEINSLLNSSTPGQVRNVEKVVVHRKFSLSSYDYDIGLVILDKPFMITSTLKPVAIRKDSTLMGQYCEISGFGGVESNTGPNRLNLIQTLMTTYDYDQCKKKYKKSKFKTEMICATTNDMKFCMDEYGMPLVCYGELTGITAMYDKTNCSQINLPIAYTEVAAYRDWIMKNKASSMEISFVGILSVSLLFFLNKNRIYS